MRVFVFGDYEFLGAIYGITGANGKIAYEKYLKIKQKYQKLIPPPSHRNAVTNIKYSYCRSSLLFTLHLHLRGNSKAKNRKRSKCSKDPYIIK